MKRTHCVATQPDQPPPELPPELWRAIWRHSEERERWLVINRAWLGFANEALWLETRESFNQQLYDRTTPSELATMIHSDTAVRISYTAAALWAERQAQYAPPEFCRAMRVLEGVWDWCCAFGYHSRMPIAQPARCGQVYLLFLEPGATSYALLALRVYKRFFRHTRQHNPNAVTRLEGLWSPQLDATLQYIAATAVQLPVDAPVRHYEDYPAINLQTTWWRMVGSGIEPDALARFLSRKYAMDEAVRLAGAQLLACLKAPPIAVSPCEKSQSQSQSQQGIHKVARVARVSAKNGK